MCDRWASPFTTPRCRPCCGLESVPGSSTKRLCGECHGSQRESLLPHPLSGLCSGQWPRHSSPSQTSHTMRLLFAVNTVYVMVKCGSSAAMATQTALHLSGPLYPTTIVPLFVRKVWRDITGVPVRHEQILLVSMNSEWGRGGGMYETNIREAERVAINQSRGIRGGTLSFHIFLSTPLPALMILKQRLYSDLTGFPTTLLLPQPHGIMSP